jgi:hypothetical protein
MAFGQASAPGGFSQLLFKSQVAFSDYFCSSIAVRSMAIQKSGIRNGFKRHHSGNKTQK